VNDVAKVFRRLSYTKPSQTRLSQCSRIGYVFFVFFQISKKHDFLRFFEMTYQKVVKSHQQKFSTQYVTKEWSLRSMITVIQFLAPRSNCTYDFIHNRKRNRLTEARARDLVYVHLNLKLLQKLQSLDYQEANVEWERWAVSDSDSSEEEQ